jgi:membrane-bound lytic murein transglycosylase A
MQGKRGLFILAGMFLCIAVYILFLRKDEYASSQKQLVRDEAPSDFKDSLLAGDVSSIVHSLDNSLEYLRRHQSSHFRFGELNLTGEEMSRTLQDIRKAFVRWGVTTKTYQYLTTNYLFFRSSAEKVLITGYYQARLRGSRKQQGNYQHPLYRKPLDLGTLSPYHTRAEIDFNGALAGRGLELVWLDDPIERTFLQIQGSGLVTLDDGSLLQVGYAGKNGHPYRPIGKYLINEGLVERSEMSMQAIKKFLKENPDKMKEVFEYDPSYVFFTERSDGPYGSLSVPVTGFRSIATDSSLFPKGAFGFIQFPLSKNHFNLVEPSGSDTVSLYVLNQDTGGAIRGADRVDLFVGAGDAQEQFAGLMQQRGQLYFMVKPYEALPKPPV